MIRRILSALAAGALLTGVASLPAAADFLIPPGGLGELVGMALDPDTDRLWMAGVDAEDGTLVGLTEDGEQAQINWGGDIVSVQGLAIHEGALFIGDIGDARGERDTITVFRMADLEPGRKTYWAYDFEYEDGPRDAKALVVSDSGRFYFVTAGDDPGIYRAPSQPSRQAVNELTRVADAPEGVTDGVALPDGETVALRTADGVHVLDATSWGTIAVETYVDPPADEAITVRGSRLLIGDAEDVREADVPTSDTTTTPRPVESPSPSADDSPSPGESATPGPGESAGGTPGNEGAIIALGMAAVVAVIAAAVTFFART